MYHCCTLLFYCHGLSSTGSPVDWRRSSCVRRVYPPPQVPRRPLCRPTTTAAELTTPVNNPPSGKTPQSIDDDLWLLWDLFFNMARQEPLNHPSQGKLVELLAAIKHLPAPIHPERKCFEDPWGFRLQTELPILGANIREIWNLGPWESSPNHVRG